MARPKGIRSDRLRKLIAAAIDQGWQHETGGKHPMVICPVCGHEEIYTASGRQFHHEIKSKISRLRWHGLIFDGIKKEHPPVNEENDHE